MFDQLFAQLTQTLNQVIGLVLSFVFDLIWIITSVYWTFATRVLAYVGAQIELLTHTLSTAIFAPLISQISGSLVGSVNIAWVIALIVLGLCYMLAPIARIRVVSARSMMTWYIVALAFFQVGPTLYTTMDNFRGMVQGAFYATTLSYFQASTAIGQLAVQNTSTGVSSLGLTNLCDNFGPYTGSPVNYFNGIDVALAFLRADGYDVIGHLPSSGNALCATSSPMPSVQWSLPRSWYDASSFFDAAHVPGLPGSDFLTLTSDKQAQIIVNALTGTLRMFASITLLIFGLIEQTVNLCLTIAEGLTFISFAIALLFSFFKRTEPIAMAMVDQWVALIVQTIMIALLQSLIVSFLVTLALTNNQVVAVGVSIIGLIIEVLIAKSALTAIQKTFDGLFNAFGKATGGTVGSLSDAAGSVAGVGMGLATGGLSGMAMLAGGGSKMQAVGATFGDSSALNGAMRMFRQTQPRDSALGDGAAEFLEGAAFRQIGQAVGGKIPGAPIGSYIGGRLLHQPSVKNKNKGNAADDSDNDDDTTADKSATGIPNSRSQKQPAAGQQPETALGFPNRGRQGQIDAVRLPAVPYKARVTEADYIDAEILPDDLAITSPWRAAEGIFRPAAPLLLIGSGDEPGAANTPTDLQPSPTGSASGLELTPPPTTESDIATASDQPEASDKAIFNRPTAAKAIQQGQSAPVDQWLEGEIITDERQIAAAAQNSSSVQEAAIDISTARLTAEANDDETDLAHVDEAIADNTLSETKGDTGALNTVIQNGEHHSDQTAAAASNALSAAANALSGAATDLSRSAQRADTAQRREETAQRLAQAEGTFSVQGTGNISAALANLVDTLRPSLTANSTGEKSALPDFQTIARATAQVTGMTPAADTSPLTGGDMTRVGLFTNKALDMGLSGDGTQTVVSDVRNSPDRQLRPETRQALTQELVAKQGYSDRSAEAQVDQLEHYAQMLPPELNVYGQRTVAVAPDGSLSEPEATTAKPMADTVTGSANRSAPPADITPFATAPLSTDTPASAAVPNHSISTAIPTVTNLVADTPLLNSPLPVHPLSAIPVTPVSTTADVLIVTAPDPAPAVSAPLPVETAAKESILKRLRRYESSKQNEPIPGDEP